MFPCRTAIALFAVFAILILTCSLVPALPPPVFHGNVQSKIFHQSSCRYFNCKNFKEVFKSREAALKAGYRPCKVCKP